MANGRCSCGAIRTAPTKAVDGQLPQYVVVIFDESYGLLEVQGPFLTKEKADLYADACDYSNVIAKRVCEPDE